MRKVIQFERELEADAGIVFTALRSPSGTSSANTFQTAPPPIPSRRYIDFLGKRKWEQSDPVWE